MHRWRKREQQKQVRRQWSNLDTQRAGKPFAADLHRKSMKTLPYTASNQPERKARKWNHNTRRAVKFAFLMVTLDENEETKHVWKQFAPKKKSHKCSRNHTLLSTRYTSDFTLRTPHFTLYTPDSPLPTPHLRLHTLHFTLQTPHCPLHT